MRRRLKPTHRHAVKSFLLKSLWTRFTFPIAFTSLVENRGGRERDMKRYITLAIFLILSVASAQAVRAYLAGADLNGTTLLSLGATSLNLKYTINTGINFGLAGEATAGRQLLLGAVAVAISIAVIVWGALSRHAWSSVAAGLFAGGGLANAFERVAGGGVFDYLNVSTTYLSNPFSFNLADVYIFLGLVLFLFDPQHSEDEALPPQLRSRARVVGLAQSLGNFVLAAALVIACLYVSWQGLSRVHFLYGEIYDYNELEAHVDKYAPQNRNGKESFTETTREERVRIFAEISDEINTGGAGLGDISYSHAGGSETFLVDAERDHLQDVSNLVATLKPVGAITATVLVAFYLACWVYMAARQRYLWRPKPFLTSVLQIALLAAVGAGVTLIIGPQQVFYTLHEWAFTDKAQWFFYYQDSLMTTLMPEVVFANIAILLAATTIALWILVSALLRRFLL